uniref:Translation initiation factor IF-2 n=1 Tax=candidate division CPR3 bacterium TaxID=2268181 RepID=A0A7C5YW08_UNCC3
MPMKNTNKQKQFLYKPPVVGIMGHVDHGKTTLLDAIRKSNIVDKEYGGITQHINAYQVVYKDKKITFIDTPGHEAFTEMRRRGADSTDIIVLVVAADEGVRPQTKEVIDLWKNSNDKLIVAINKIDKEDAKPDRIKQELVENGVPLEGFGGDVPYVEVSALKNRNIDLLLDTILLVAELNEIDKAPTLENAEYIGEGIVLESYLDHSLGFVSLVIVRVGEFRRGLYVSGGKICSKIRALLNEGRKTVDIADISTPIYIIGMPQALPLGEIVRCYIDEKIAKNQVEESINIQKEKSVEVLKEDILTRLASYVEGEKSRSFNVVLKADTAGTLEAIRRALLKIKVEGVRLAIVRDSTGNIVEDDIEFAKTVNGIVLGFNVKLDPAAEKLSREMGVVTRIYKVIYELIEEVKGAMEGIVEIEEEEKILGEAEIKKVYELSDKTKVAGCLVLSGVISRNGNVYIERNGQRVHQAQITTLKHFKEDIKEAHKGMECGVKISPQFDIKEGDKIVLFKIVKGE